MMRGIIARLLKGHPAKSQFGPTNSATSARKSTWPKHRIFATTVDLSHNDNESTINLADIHKGSDEG